MFKQLTFTALLALFALTGGCASVKMADETLDAQAKTFQVSPDKANIYVYRNESMGAGVKMPVTLNGKPVGQTVAKSYLMLAVRLASRLWCLRRKTTRTETHRRSGQKLLCLAGSESGFHQGA